MSENTSPPAVSGAPEALKEIRKLAHWEPADDLQALRTRLACIGAKCVDASPVSPLRDAEGATAAATPPSREDYALHDELPKPLARETTIDARLLALEAVAHSPKRLDEELLNIEKRLKAYIDSKSESERILRAALELIASCKFVADHTCVKGAHPDAIFGTNRCVPCIAQRALDEAQKEK